MRWAWPHSRDPSQSCRTPTACSAQWLGLSWFPDRFAIGKASDSGQTIVETALSLLIAITVSFAVFEFSILMYSYCALNEAVREGVRYAVVHGSDSSSCSGPGSGCADSSSANVKTLVCNTASSSFLSIQAADVLVTYNPADSSAPNTSVTVSITKTYVPLIAFLAITPTITVTSQGRIIY